jgi:4-amino-4-deoxy-L-arabinose transferase-like glycosyltransferase
MDETLEHSKLRGRNPGNGRDRSGSKLGLIPLLFAAAIFIGCIISPPSLMDDVDAVQAQIARNMVTSGDWVIARLDGVPYLEKSPMIYWLMGISYKLFGFHDWAARVPVACAAVLLAWVVFLYGRWAFGTEAGSLAGMVVGTSIGLFLFTRIQIPDVMLTLVICAGFWAFQRATDKDEPASRQWAALFWVLLGLGLLIKGLIAVVVPAGGIFVYLVATRQLFARSVWKRIHLFTGIFVCLAIAAPWHVIAAMRMPPLFDFTMHSGPGGYHGFFWFYFINEHLLRFLNLRYPRDYNTVPRLAFWGLHLLWLFPWSVYLPAVAKLNFKPRDRAGQTRLLAVCWTGFLLLFFTFSTTQEYYSMPVYPALALLIGGAMDTDSEWSRVGTRVLGGIAALCTVLIGILLFLVRNLPAPGDISQALQQHPEVYTLSLGHMGDLTIQSFAYLRAPLVLAGIAFAFGTAACWLMRNRRAYLAIAVMMVFFFHAARMALVVFDPYLSSRPLAEALKQAPHGRLILNGEYYSFSSVFFYANRDALLWNGRFDNLEYGSYAPGSPNVFIDDSNFTGLWNSRQRYFVLSDSEGLAHLKKIAAEQLHLVAESGGKTLYSNLPPQNLPKVNPSEEPDSNLSNQKHR